MKGYNIMRLYYSVGDCGFLEEVDQIFTLKINQECTDETPELKDFPSLAAVTHGQTVIMFSKDDLSIKECNNKLRTTSDLIDLSGWKLIRVVSLEDFERARLASAQTNVKEPEEGVKEIDTVVGEVEEND